MTNYDTPERLDAGLEKLFADLPDAPRYFFENLADHAAEQVELDVEEIDTYYPGDWRPRISKAAVPAQDEVTVDATDYVQAGLIDYQDGTHEHADPAGPGLVRVNVKDPQVFVVDKDGNRIEGGRVMVTYYTIEMDTP